MRDDGRTRRWRVSLRLFRALCLAVALLPPLLGGAGWLAWILYNDNETLSSQQRQLEQKNKTLNAALRRLSNLEQLLEMPDDTKLLALQSQQPKLKATEQGIAPSEILPPENTK
jgi:hypothetical protein